MADKNASKIPFAPPGEDPAAPHLRIGRIGEKLACQFLFKKGFRILERNYKWLRGEIDIIAEKDGRIRFVEVKTRTSEEYGPPEERVDQTKMEMLRQTARHYLEEFRDPPRSGFQFDVLAQVINPAGRVIEQTFFEDSI
jgi:putative endonuclease